MAGDWGFLSSLLNKVQSHSTGIGKIWMTVLLLFRIMVLCGPADNVWGDEMSNFVCNNNAVGCQSLCYTYFFPISHIRYWTLQIIFVSTPTLWYLGHVMHVIHKENKLRKQLASSPAPPGGTRKLKHPRYTDESGHVKIEGNLLCTYLIHLVVKILIEVASIVGQYYLYHKTIFLEAEYTCSIEPCHSKGVACYPSRHVEKNVFIVFMLAVACFSVLLNVLEVLYLLCRCCRRRRNCRAVKRTAVEDPDRLPGGSAPSYNSTMVQNTEDTPWQSNDVIVELENILGRRSLSGSLGGGEGGETAALIHHHSEDLLSPKVTE